MPELVEIREDEWVSRGFDKYSALQVIDNGEGGYIFFVNMDNVYLRTEMKSPSPTMDVKLLEARFKFGLVLIGLALLQEYREQKDGRQGISPDEEYETIEQRVFNISKGIAPVLLPMIEGLKDLELPEENLATAQPEMD
jgi:hypothetical protein